MDFFKGRSLVIATKHGKEKVIAPVFENHLRVQCILPVDFDTDAFGTFTGEIPRKKDVKSTLREKCLQAMRMTNTDLGIASEGSFGPHPEIPFVPADEEVMIFIDLKNHLQVFAGERSTETNFNSIEIRSLYELLTFTEQVGFPSHKIILKGEKADETKFIKGIKSLPDLVYQFTALIDSTYRVTAETDMRAMNNPTRMKVIERAARNLLEKILITCPNCGSPGFEISSVRHGLPCILCRTPTSTISHVIHACQICNYSEEKNIPEGKLFQDPMFCPSCNP